MKTGYAKALKELRLFKITLLFSGVLVLLTSIIIGWFTLFMGSIPALIALGVAIIPGLFGGAVMEAAGKKVSPWLKAKFLPAVGALMLGIITGNIGGYFIEGLICNAAKKSSHRYITAIENYHAVKGFYPGSLSEVQVPSNWFLDRFEDPDYEQQNRETFQLRSIKDRRGMLSERWTYESDNKSWHLD